MKCFLGFWHHQREEDPVWMLSEVDEDANVVRQIDRYRSGYRVCRTASSEGRGSLIDIEFDAELLSDESGEISNFVVTKAEFERHWIASIEILK